MSLQIDLKQVHRRRLMEHVIDQLVSLIVSGKIKSGNKLPPERELMKLIGVGRSSVREAIGALTLMGVLVIHPGKGTYVNTDEEAFLAKPLSWAMPLGRARIQDLIEARNIIEMGVALLAAQRATESDIEEMRRFLETEKSNKRNLRKVIDAGMAFHSALAKSSHNSVLIDVDNKIHNLMRSWTEEVLLVPGVYETSIGEHGEILNAVTMRNKSMVRAAVSKHLDSARHALESSVLMKTKPNTYTKKQK